MDTKVHTLYSNRCWKAKAGKFFYIQPFADAPFGTELVELILDNNAFIESTKNKNALIGAGCIPNIREIVVNPFPALAEQWVSNPQFWSNRRSPLEHPQSKLISDFVKVADSIGVKYPANYSEIMIGNLRDGDASIRSDLGVLYGYLAAIRSIQQKKAKLDDKLRQFKDLLITGIPRFNGLIGLAVLTFYFQANRNVTDESGKQVISFLDSFFSPKGEEPDSISMQYLRNRGADLWSWYLMPRIYQGKNIEILALSGTPILVTADKFLASIPFRFMPPTIGKTGNGSCLEFRFSPDGVSDEHQRNLLDIYKAVAMEARPDTLPSEQSNRMDSLFKKVYDMLNLEDKPGFHSAWEWAFSQNG